MTLPFNDMLIYYPGLHTIDKDMVIDIIIRCTAVTLCCYAFVVYMRNIGVVLAQIGVIMVQIDTFWEK